MSEWFQWVEARFRTANDRLNNLEESLASLHKQQRRMLGVIIIVVVINGVLLFYF